MALLMTTAAGGCDHKAVVAPGTGGHGGGAVEGRLGGAGGSGGSGQAGVGGSPTTDIGTGGIFDPIGDGGSTVMGGGGSCPGSAGSPGNSLSFGAPVESLTHAGSFLVALGDLNGDGKPDLAVTNYESQPTAGASGGTSPGTGVGTGGWVPAAALGCRAA